jgi:hypothetical protein
MSESITSRRPAYYTCEAISTTFLGQPRSIAYLDTFVERLEKSGRPSLSRWTNLHEEQNLLYLSVAMEESEKSELITHSHSVYGASLHLGPLQKV